MLTLRDPDGNKLCVVEIMGTFPKTDRARQGASPGQVASPGAGNEPLAVEQGRRDPPAESFETSNYRREATGNRLNLPTCPWQCESTH